MGRSVETTKCHRPGCRPPGSRIPGSHYGNTWVETPELNRLASQSLLVEFPIADAYELESLYRSYWFGCHALSEPVIPSRDRLTLPAKLRGLRSTLLTDDPRLAALSLADDFDQRIAVAIPDATAAARNAEETQLGQFFAAALDWMSRETPVSALAALTRFGGCLGCAGRIPGAVSR